MCHIDVSLCFPLPLSPKINGKISSGGDEQQQKKTRTWGQRRWRRLRVPETGEGLPEAPPTSLWLAPNSWKCVTRSPHTKTEQNMAAPAK